MVYICPISNLLHFPKLPRPLHGPQYQQHQPRQMDLMSTTTKKKRREKYFQTATYCCTYISQGLTGGCIGPTLLLLASNTSAALDDIGLIFTFRGVGWIIGSLVSGKLYELSFFSGRRHRILAFAVVAMAAFLFVFPFITNFYLLLFLHFLHALLMSANDVGCNSLMFIVWGTEVNPYMQLLHFSFGIGATASPAIIAMVLWVAPANQQLLWSYWVLGGIVSLPLLLVFSVKSPNPADTLNDKSNEETQTRAVSLRDKLRDWTIILLTAFILFLYVGAEMAYAGWIFTYAVTVCGFSDTEADYLSSGFWGAITVGRLLAVPIATRCSSRRVLWSDHLSSTLFIALALMFVTPQSRFLLWAVSLAYGIAMASIYATTFSFPSLLGVKLTSSASSIQIVGSSLGSMLLPMFEGFLFTHVGPSTLMWTTFISNCIMLFAFMFIGYGLPLCCNLKVGGGKDINLNNDGEDGLELLEMESETSMKQLSQKEKKDNNLLRVDDVEALDQ
jgi:FHS family Na+ dependent glucose MFS transporter 1